jgi:hypothetical protein
MEAAIFILFLVWTYVVFKVAHAQGRLTGGREGARALARHAQHYKLQNLDEIEADSETLDVRKTLSKLDRGGKSWASYG